MRSCPRMPLSARNGRSVGRRSRPQSCGDRVKGRTVRPAPAPPKLHAIVSSSRTRPSAAWRATRAPENGSIHPGLVVPGGSAPDRQRSICRVRHARRARFFRAARATAPSNSGVAALGPGCSESYKDLRGVGTRLVNCDILDGADATFAQMAARSCPASSPSVASSRKGKWPYRGHMDSRRRRSKASHLQLSYWKDWLPEQESNKAGTAGVQGQQPTEKAGKSAICNRHKMSKIPIKYLDRPTQNVDKERELTEGTRKPCRSKT